MKTIILFLFFISSSLIFAQKKMNVLDDNLTANHTTIIYERSDGSIFELNGKTNWTAHRVFPESRDFSDFVNAKNPIIIEFETIDGSQYSNINGGNWKKSKKRFESQGPFSLSSSYREQLKVIEVLFTLTNANLVEINLHSVYGADNILLHNKHLQSGQHRLQFQAVNIPSGEYMLVLRTQDRAESVRISIKH